MTFRRWLLTFFLLLALGAVLLGGSLAYAIHLSRQDAFLRSFGDPSLVIQEQAFRDRDRHCDVVIYGDSTASIGIDPPTITKETGLSACNLATTRPVVDDLGTLPLDVYLEHNPKPRVIVFQFGPELFYRGGNPWTLSGPVAPFLMLARNEPTGEAVKTMLLHSPEATQFVIDILQQRFGKKKPSPAQVKVMQTTMQDWQQSNGRLELQLPAESACSEPALKLRGPVDSAWIAELHKRYEAKGIAVIVRASPVPDCDPQRAQFVKDLSGHVDVNVQPLPIGDFVAGGRHTTSPGAVVETEGVVEAIRSRAK